MKPTDTIKIKQMAGLPLTEQEHIASLLQPMQEGFGAGAYLVVSVDLNNNTFSRNNVQWNGQDIGDLVSSLWFQPGYTPTDGDREEINDFIKGLKRTNEGWIGRPNEELIYIITQV